MKLLITSVIACAFVLLGGTGVAASQVPEDVEEQGQVSAPAVSVTVEAGDNQTVLTRIEVLKYSTANDIRLDDWEIIYIETNVVQDSGPRELYPGDKLEIDINLIKIYTDKRKEVPQNLVNKWNAYARLADL